MDEMLSWPDWLTCVTPLRLLHTFLLVVILSRQKFTQLFVIYTKFWSIYINICENCNTFCNINS